MEYNQDTGLASVSGWRGEGVEEEGETAVTVALPHVSIYWRYEGGGPQRGLRGRKGEWCVRAFSSTVTYGPFSRDYIQSSDLARKRRLGARQAGWPRLWTPIGAARFVPSETEKRISPIFSLAKISSLGFN